MNTASTNLRSSRGDGHIRALLLAVAFIGSCCSGWAQSAKPAAAPATAQSDYPPDRIGRTTPRGTVLGFLNAARKHDYKTAVQYLNTRLRGEEAEELAEQVYVVLDRRLPARLTQISDRPEGSQGYSGEPNQDLVGTIETGNGPLDIVLERIQRPKASPHWLFSSKTLEKIPPIYDEITSVPLENYIPEFLMEPRILGIALIEWIGLIIGLPFVYFIIALLDVLVSRWIGQLYRRLWHNPELSIPKLLPNPIRLFIIVVLIRWMLSAASLPLLARQLWSIASVVVAIAGCVWLLIQLITWFERRVHTRFIKHNLQAATPLLRFCRTIANILVMFMGVVVVLRYFGVNTTAALAGLGVGGIAIALAAQKTLENVIGGLSVILDRSITVGDYVKLSGTEGTVIEIGLRSTRIRTNERTLVSVPNGQISTASLENVSRRDKFWFRHTLGLRYETTAPQIREVADEINHLLLVYPNIEKDSVRVRFLRFGPSSLDIEIVAYLFASDWNHFLTLQQELLLEIMNIIEGARLELALPSQTLYCATLPTKNPGTQRNELSAMR